MLSCTWGICQYIREVVSFTAALSCTQGVDAMVPFITDRVVPVSKEDVECLLLEPNPLALSLSLQAQQALQGLGQ